MYHIIVSTLRTNTHLYRLHRYYLLTTFREEVPQGVNGDARNYYSLLTYFLVARTLWLLGQVLIVPAGVTDDG